MTAGGVVAASALVGALVIADRSDGRTPTASPTGRSSITPSASRLTSATGSTATVQVPGRLTVSPSPRGQDVTAIRCRRRSHPDDAGTNSAALRPVLDTLASRQVWATFFPTWMWAAANPPGYGPSATADTEWATEADEECEHGSRREALDGGSDGRFSAGHREARTSTAWAVCPNLTGLRALEVSR